MAARLSQPNCFIVGAAKSGTTSLAKYLGQHPEIFMPAPYKEPAYFADHTGHTRWEDYLSEFEEASDCCVVGEKSVAHLYDPHAAERIHRFNPQAKIIVSLRNPVDMAYSLYQHNRREGYESLSAFDEALAREDARASQPEFCRDAIGYYANYFYRRRATYYPQVKRYFDTFGADQVLIIRFEDLKKDAHSVCRTIFRFLGVDEEITPIVTPENVGGNMRLQFLQNWYVRNAMLRKAVVSTTPRSLRRLVYRWNRRPAAAPPLSPSDRQRYGKLFAEDIEQLRSEYAIEVA